MYVFVHVRLDHLIYEYVSNQYDRYVHSQTKLALRDALVYTYIPLLDHVLFDCKHN